MARILDPEALAPLTPAALGRIIAAEAEDLVRLVDIDTHEATDTLDMVDTTMVNLVRLYRALVATRKNEAYLVSVGEAEHFIDDDAAATILAGYAAA